VTEDCEAAHGHRPKGRQRVIPSLRHRGAWHRTEKVERNVTIASGWWINSRGSNSVARVATSSPQKNGTITQLRTGKLGPKSEEPKELQRTCSM